MMDKLDSHCQSLIDQLVGFENQKLYEKVLKELKIVQEERLCREICHALDYPYTITEKFKRQKYLTTIHVSQYNKIREFRDYEVEEIHELLVYISHDRPKDISEHYKRLCM